MATETVRVGVKLVLAALLSGFVAACGASEAPAGQPSTVSLAADLSPACASALVAGVQYWNEHGVPLEIVHGRRGDVHVIPIELPGTTAGRTRIGGGLPTQIEIEVCHGAPGVSVAAHELGHALGLIEHHPDPRNLMHWRTRDGLNMAIDEQQLALVGVL